MRPALHFTARSGWINDPHGITVRDGGYQAFFQYVPDSVAWAPNCHWGHATGHDLLSLTELPVAIAPGDGDDGIWTGSLVTDGADVRVFYTATALPDFGIGRVRVAFPKDADWIDWAKGPVVAEAPTDLDIIAYRDPFIRREGHGWRMFVGAALRDGTAAALSYTSPDLTSWEYDGITLRRATTERDPVWMGALWECPQIFDVNSREVMVSSVWDDDVLHYAGYALGTYADGRFAAEAWGRLTYGDSYYAPSLFVDADGEPCLSFWMRGIEDLEAGWAGAHSVPHRLRVDGDILIAEPHPDVARHRTGRIADGRVNGLAADAEWQAQSGELVVSSGDGTLASIRRDGTQAVASIDGHETTFPAAGAVRIIVDGPVLEVSSEAALFGARVTPAGYSLVIAASGGRLDVYGLA
nr:glycoside hydrolase family 32 protein [Microbacterium bovistercoris]